MLDFHRRRTALGLNKVIVHPGLGKGSKKRKKKNVTKKCQTIGPVFFCFFF